MTHTVQTHSVHCLLLPVIYALIFIHRHRPTRVDVAMQSLYSAARGCFSQSVHSLLEDV